MAMLRRFGITARRQPENGTPIDFLKKSARRANLNSLNGGIAQLVERLVRKDFLGSCDSLGLSWTEHDRCNGDE